MQDKRMEALIVHDVMKRTCQHAHKEYTERLEWS